MKKRLHTFGKVIGSLALVATMVLGSVDTNVYAVTSESLGNTVNENGDFIRKVEGNDEKGSFTVKLSNTGDTILVYQLASVAWDNDNKVYTEPVWVEPVKNWINSKYGADNAIYKTPKDLAAASSTIWESFFTALLSDSGNVLDQLTDIDNGIESEDDKHVRNITSQAVVLTAENVASLKRLEAVEVYIDPETNVKYLKDGTNFTTTDVVPVNVTDDVVKARLEQVTATTAYRDSSNNYYLLGETYQAPLNEATVTDVDFGIYAVIGTASNTSIEYNPVTVNVVPYQEGPVNSWYINENIIASLKAGAISIDKKINDLEQDTVSIGEEVRFSITCGNPIYSDRVTLASTYTAVRDYTMTVDDVMSNAFSYVPGSVKVQYRTDTAGAWVDFSAASHTTSYKDVSYNAYANSTYFTTDANKNTTQNPITSDNLESVSNSITTNSQLVGNYYIPQTGDVYTTQIASRAVDKDPKYSSKYADNRGGYGVSVFACGTLSHKDDYQLFLFRYKGQENLYYWYYYRDSAYNLLRIDDCVTGKYTTKLSDVDTSVEGGKINTDTSYSGTLDLTNGSTYLTNIRILYQNRTGDKTNHGTQYYADWSVNVFNVTFNVGALNAWMKANSITKIVQFRIVYDATVTEQVQIASEANTNKAIFNYEIDAAGLNVGSIEDTVNAYTYGLNVVKIDGETVNNATPTYLDQVEFTLFKETDTFIKHGEGAATWVSSMGAVDGLTYEKSDDPETDASNMATALGSARSTYISEQRAILNKGKEVSDPDYVTEEKFKSLSTYEGLFPEGKDSNGQYQYYYYTVTAETDGVTDSLAPYVAGDQITRVFKRYEVSYANDVYKFDGIIKTVANAQGTTVPGLDVGNYVLIESKTRADYNGLAEDILLSIKRMDDETAEYTYNGSLIAFRDAGNEINDTGIYKLNVLNYKGLQLPSTGGIGTKLFTIIGIVIMAGVMVLMIVKKRKG